MDEHVADLVAEAHRSLPHAPNRFLDRLEAGDVPVERLRATAGELYHLVSADRRSFAMLAARFGEPLFLAMAGAEQEALRLLLDFAGALGLAEKELRAHEPRPLAQAYPAFLAQTSVFGPRSAVPLALLVNVGESGGCYTRTADALQARYGLSDAAVGHFRFFADTPAEVLDQAAAVVSAGLSTGDDRAEVLRAARMVHAYEAMFWDAMAA